MTDVTLDYTVDGISKSNVYTDVTVDVSVVKNTITLTFPKLTSNYDTLHADMSGVLTSIKIIFTAMGNERDYESLYMEKTIYVEQIDESSNQTYQITIVFEYGA